MEKEGKDLPALLKAFDYYRKIFKIHLTPLLQSNNRTNDGKLSVKKKIIIFARHFYFLIKQNIYEKNYYNFLAIGFYSV